MNEPLPALPNVFREFLYADLERTRSLFAQRLGGVPEESRVTDSLLRHHALGVARYLGVGREEKAEHYEQRSLLDALFPALEELLEAEQWLTDISDIVHDESGADLDALRDVVEPGSIVRLTADGTLFDAEYFARVLGGTSVAATGLSSLVSGGAQGDSDIPKQKPKGQRGKPSAPADGIAPQRKLEDLVEEFPSQLMGGDVTADQFRSMIRVARGMFPTGLHLILETDGGAGWTATARLQKDRQYLEVDPDVLFSRYGTAPLEWTIVGSIGYFSEDLSAPEMNERSFLRSDNRVSRTGFVQGLNAMMAFVANTGMADAPPHPGFSIIPLAVYRTIPQAVQQEQTPSPGG